MGQTCEVVKPMDPKIHDSLNKFLFLGTTRHTWIKRHWTQRRGGANWSTGTQGRAANRIDGTEGHGTCGVQFS